MMSIHWLTVGKAIRFEHELLRETLKVFAIAQIEHISLIGSASKDQVLFVQASSNGIDQLFFIERPFVVCGGQEDRKGTLKSSEDFLL